MEKILRLVKCSDRLPDRDKWYFVHLSTNAPILGIGENLKWISETQKWHGEKMLDIFEKDYVDYWYEEISFNQLVEEQAKIKFIPNQDEAKERYENALSEVNDNTWFYKDEPILDKQDVIKAIKIASGYDNNNNNENEIL